MSLRLTIGLDAIGSYRRLDYTAWHALAEFVDNSTQAYFNNRSMLDEILGEEGKTLEVNIVYDASYDGGTGLLRVTDNSIGMSYIDLQRALHIAQPPANPAGRSKYGLGLKTAACWIGNYWTIRTKKLGETTEYRVEVDVERVLSGDGEVKEAHADNRPTNQHYTVIEIRRHNRKFQGRTKSKIREFLESMYRQDFRNGTLKLSWLGEELTWRERELLCAYDGQQYRKIFEFTVDGKQVHGWVGVLAKGSRSEAGFAMLYYDRVIKGYPDAWRPGSLYGQYLGSNDLINQRLVGEIHLDQFEVSHTKDGIQWLGDQEDQVEEELLKHCGDYRDVAKEHRKGTEDSRGPSQIETKVAVEELQRELESPEMIDAIRLSVAVPEQVVDRALQTLAETVKTREETFRANVGGLLVSLYLVDWSPNDPYIILDTAGSERIVIMVNTAHPHWLELKGSDGVLNYLRHCTYDGIAEWQARQKAGRIDPATIKMFKDRLLRVPLEIEANMGD